MAREWPSLRAARISATGTIPSGRRPATDATSRRAQCRWPSTAVKDGGAAGRVSRGRERGPRAGGAEMVAEDRRLRLAGDEIYRFGGWERTRPQLVQDFFTELFARHRKPVP
ncbi:hypothetical protein ABT272_41970 [Streptomyces sp900105245]|uniref:Uncharacterized protein n=1 Tax=Streptomyces sp. 900105245 TaxID=3154379 RepID=A0ABV1ULW5_9ACTN